MEVPEELADGTMVAIIAGDQGAEEQLSEAQQQELEEALRQIRSGSFVDGRQLLDELRA